MSENNENGGLSSTAESTSDHNSSSASDSGLDDGYSDVGVSNGTLVEESGTNQDTTVQISIVTEGESHGEDEALCSEGEPGTSSHDHGATTYLEPLDAKEGSSHDYSLLANGNQEDVFVEPMADGRVDSMMDKPLIQESRSFQLDMVHRGDGSLVNEEDGSFQVSSSDSSAEHEGLTSSFVAVEEVSKEETFVDAPDELDTLERRNSGVEDLVIVSENDVRDGPSPRENESLMMEDEKTLEIKTELAKMQHELAKTIAEKELIAREFEEFKLSMASSKEAPVLNQELMVTLTNSVEKLGAAIGSSPLIISDDSDATSFISQFSTTVHAAIDELDARLRKLEEERAAFAREFIDLHHQLRILTEQQLLSTESGDALVDRLRLAEENVCDSMDMALDVPLHEMLNDCSKFAIQLHDALGERIHAEGTMRELHAVLFTKDQEIEELNARITELSEKSSELANFYGAFEAKCEELSSEVVQDAIARDVVFSYVGSLQKIWAEGDAYMKVSTGKCLEEKRALLEQWGKAQQSLEEANSERNKMRMDLEQAENKLLTAKEKLSLAVSKGKSLVQQRDLLRQSLSEKTNELEKCLLELQQKSELLDATQVSSDKHVHMLEEELLETKSWLSSLQESLMQKSTTIQELERIISQVNMLEELSSKQIVDKVGWLVDQKQALENFLKEKDGLINKYSDAFSCFDVPKTVSSLEGRIEWLRVSFSQAKDEITRLKNKASLCESELMEAQTEIKNLKTSLSEERQKRDSLQMGFEELTGKYTDIVKQSHQVSSEKEELMERLIEVAGYIDNQQVVYQSPSDSGFVFEKCLQIITERINTSSLVDMEELQRLHNLVNDKDQELEQYYKMLLEASILEAVEKSQMSDLSQEARKLSEELLALKTERDALQKELVRTEEKSSLLREKLSLAVKKGKGLLQDRENLKLSLEEKNADIEKLKVEVERHEAAVSECKDQIKKLSADLERLPILELEITMAKDQREQVEKYLLESNSMLQRVMDAIETIVLPTELVFEEPIDKVKWIGEFISDKIHSEQELEKAKEEALIQARKLEDASAFIKSLEDTLSQAASKLSLLSDEKSRGESENDHEMRVLKTELAACMAELTKTRSRLDNQTSNLIGQLDFLRMLHKDESRMLPLMINSFSKKIEGLKSLEQLLHDILNQLAQLKHSDSLHEDTQVHSHNLIDKQNGRFPSLANPVAECEEHPNGMADSIEAGREDIVDNLPSYIAEGLEGLHRVIKNLGGKFEGFSTSLDSQITVLLQLLQTTKNEVNLMSQFMEAIRVDFNNLTSYNKIQENAISTLQKGINILLSACADATEELQIVESDNFTKLLSFKIDSQDQNVYVQEKLDEIDKSVKAVLNFLSVARERIQVQSLELNDVKAKLLEAELVGTERSRTLEEVQSKLKETELVGIERSRTLEALQNKLKETELTSENAVRERDVNIERISKLESDGESLHNSCNELKLMLEDYQACKDLLKAKEDELLLVPRNLAAKDQESSKHIMSGSQLETLFEKVKGLKFEHDNTETKSSNFMLGLGDKLFYIVDHYLELEERVNMLIHEKEKVQSVLVSHDSEVLHLRQENARLADNAQDTETKANEIADLISGLERIISNYGGNGILEEKEPLSAKAILLLLEKMVISIVQDSENLKLRSQSLDAMLRSSQNVVDDLSAKVKLLEASHSEQADPQEMDHERSAFVASSQATGSEISEIDDTSSKSPIPTISPAAAHVRTLRKGSTDHLALTIDTESDRLINNQLEDDDKGHVFKSLNTSGLIPKSAKLMADKIDGVWVSAGRVLMRRPGARMGLITYWLLLHLCAFASIL
ncbi:coiled-coil domain-containing protein 18 isoform X1 [Amborella trichopoda]|uniref:Uncharacterized protein n=2 Tax=Amborella trichopoda TaxID=13333 RepID=W1Q0V9_AMBTC|nr:coiled-coil domain-containing protein 18 isoform X1 [Amborella trichopoda]XP_020527599.1 coiled-coil domain-containing protein 18 isoform X1 [Amborella trichopoda]ERN13755.1 hypothetical protein AMTR_s00049p00185400 [Amborella trichopoda]|eukprot:XP_020527598.1 coiled-coil domain-containing protein 18 isoform X1 [Amborella trichopoda]